MVEIHWFGLVLLIFFSIGGLFALFVNILKGFVHEPPIDPKVVVKLDKEMVELTSINEALSERNRLLEDKMFCGHRTIDFKSTEGGCSLCKLLKPANNNFVGGLDSDVIYPVKKSKKTTKRKKK